MEGCILGKTGLRFHVFGEALDRATFLEGNCRHGGILVDAKSVETYGDNALRFEENDEIEDSFWAIEDIDIDDIIGF